METREGWIIEDIGANDVYAVSAPDDAAFHSAMRTLADAAFYSAMRAARASIADLRRERNGIAASILRDEWMNHFEAWLDPGAGVFRDDLQAQQRSFSAESARDIDPTCGF